MVHPFNPNLFISRESGWFSLSSSTIHLCNKGCIVSRNKSTQNKWRKQAASILVFCEFDVMVNFKDLNPPGHHQQLCTIWKVLVQIDIFLRWKCMFLFSICFAPMHLKLIYSTDMQNYKLRAQIIAICFDKAPPKLILIAIYKSATIQELVKQEIRPRSFP